MIKELEVFVNGHRTNYDYYKNLGYEIEYKKPCLIKINDLMYGSTISITSICDICGKEGKSQYREYFTYTNGLTNLYYCNKCNKIKAKETCLKKYGVDSPMKSDVVKNRIKDSLYNKYGVEHFSKTDEYKNKYKNTCLNKYGCENTFQFKEFKDNIKQTNLERYGVKYPQQSEDIRIKSDSTNLERYGVRKYSQTDECKLKVEKTNLERYGTNYSNTQEYKDSIKFTNLERYGVEYYTKTEEYRIYSKSKKESLTKLKYENLIGEKYKVSLYESNNFRIFHLDCGIEFSINRDVLYSRIFTGVELCTECFPVNSHQSYMEIEMQEFLNNLGISYEVKNKKILNGLELDIFIPDMNIAIEMNGVYWHSEIYMADNYHINKTSLCKENGIQLLHIWEDDWKYKRNIVKSIILNKLRLVKSNIFARKCHIKNVNTVETREFLDTNHIQGFSSSKTKLGLYYMDELVSLMTFGYRYTNGKREYELIRFCNKININVIGGASKLFSHFLNLNIEKRIISYSDISMFDGGMYEKLGFNHMSTSEPNYFWVVDGIRKHRFNFNKKKLVSEGFDINKTEAEIMHERGYYRIWGCGQKKWIYDKNSSL